MKKLIWTILLTLILNSNVWAFESTDPLYMDYQAHIFSAIHHVEAYDGIGVKVGIVDSGIAIDHEDLNLTKLIFAENFTTENRQDVEDKAGHGTFIGGLLGAQNNNHIGIKGLTPNVGLLSFKCFDETLETDIETVITCIERAIDLKVDVLNLSFTTALYSEELEAVLNKAMKQNIIVVAPSGNDLSGKKYYPAAFEGVISVNAVSVEPVSLKVSPAMLSNANNTVTLSAPGDRILSLSHVDRTDYKQRDGTSYATAYVSAAAIIAKQLMSDIDSLTFESLLKKSATDYGEKGYDAVYGHGLLNIEGMIKEVKKLDLYEFH